MDSIKITTIDEVLYHVASKELVVFSLEDGYGYIEQKGNKIIINIQPKYGSSTTSSGNRGLLRKTFKNLNALEFYVIPSLTVGTRKLTVLDRIADFLKSN